MLLFCKKILSQCPSRPIESHSTPPRILLLRFRNRLAGQSFGPEAAEEKQLLLLLELYAGAPSMPPPSSACALLPRHCSVAPLCHQNCRRRPPAAGWKEGGPPAPLTISDHLSALRPSCCEQRQSADTRQPATSSRSEQTEQAGYNNPRFSTNFSATAKRLLLGKEQVRLRRVKRGKAV